MALVLSLAMLLGGCRNNVVWSDTCPIDTNHSGWEPEEGITFTIDPEGYRNDNNRFALSTSKAVGDTVKRIFGTFNAIVAVRYTAQCNVEEIKLNVEQVALSNRPIHSDTLTLCLFNANGTPAGTGRMGIYERSASLPAPLTVEEGTAVTIAPIKTKETPKGISDVSLLLIKN